MDATNLNPANQTATDAPGQNLSPLTPPAPPAPQPTPVIPPTPPLPPVTQPTPITTALQATNVPPPNSPTPVPEEPQFSKKKESEGKGKLLMTAGPLMVVISFIASFLMFQNNNQTGNVANLATEPQTVEQHLVEVPKSGFVQVLENAPKNPDQVIATCEDTQEPVLSEVTTDCPNIKFTWSGEIINEPQASVSGYFVYLGENNNDPVLTLKNKSSDFSKAIIPETQGVFVNQNSYLASGLEKGKTYYLAIQVKSDSQTPEYRIGFSQVDLVNIGAQIAKVLFVLNYE